MAIVPSQIAIITCKKYPGFFVKPECINLGYRNRLPLGTEVHKLNQSKDKSRISNPWSPGGLNAFIEGNLYQKASLL